MFFSDSSLPKRPFVLFPLLSFSIPILSVVEYAAVYSSELNSAAVMLCLRILFNLWLYFLSFQLFLHLCSVA